MIFNDLMLINISYVQCVQDEGRRAGVGGERLNETRITRGKEENSIRGKGKFY